MAIFDSIAIEIQATIAGVLILLIITILEIIDLQRAKNRRRQELHAIISGVIPARKGRLLPLFSLILEFIFGFAAGTLFIYGMMYLIIVEKPVLAAVAGISAFIGVMAPFLIWNACRKADQEMKDALESFARRREAANREPIADTAAVQSVAAPVVEETPAPPAAEPAMIDPPPVAKPRPEPVSRPDIKVEAKPEPYPDPAHQFPQDSMLRRHFLTHLAATALPHAPAPTDSILRRHYDAMRASPTGTRQTHPVTAKTPAPTAAKSCGKCAHHVHLPEDSILRRHFLTTLGIKIEPRLSLPGRPADSMLRRHFDTHKEHLLAVELNKFLKG